MKPEIISAKTVYEGKVFDIRVDDIREGDVEYKREIVVHKGSAVLIPLFNDGTVALVRQYRHAAGRYLLELPAGTLEAGEDPEAAARRELEEEIGVTADKLEKLIEFYVSPGFVTEKMHLYVATGLKHVGQKLEADEILTIERHPLPALLNMIKNREIEDAKSIIGITIMRN